MACEELYDFIIVGAGSAGCVLASRLSEHADNRVLLIEAGPDLSKDGEPPAITDPGCLTFFKSELQWPGLLAEGAATSEGQSSPLVNIPEAKVLGGGSSINGMHFLRGFPNDYDESKSWGVTGWGWNDVLPYFIKLESDKDFEGPMHGKAGPTPIIRMPREKWSPFSHAVEAQLRQEGLPAQRDLNAEFTDGVGPLPLNITPKARVSAPRAYLGPEVRSRKNLTLRTDTHVDKILIRDRRATGVTLRIGEKTYDVAAREVIVACGAIHSPALLQRSGIGPGAVLRKAGVAVQVDRAGVGKNLNAHPTMTISARLRSAGRRRSTPGPSSMMIARYSSGVPDCPPTDMYLGVNERVISPHLDDPLGRQMGYLIAMVNKPFSRGEVAIDPANPAGPPTMRYNLYSDERDLARMTAAFRKCAQLFDSQRVAPLVDAVFLLKPSWLMFKYLGDDLVGRLISRLGGAGLDLGWHLGGAALLRSFVTPLVSVPVEEGALRDYIRMNTPLIAHGVGTCRLGRSDDPNAVVDNRGRVIGVTGLRVADCSIFPTVMGAGTHPAALMAGEKISDHIVKQHN